MPLLISKLTKKNFPLYAAKAYNNPRCLDIQEFYEDLNRFTVVRRLLKKYLEKGILEERRILNEIIILNNVFFVQAAVQMLFFKLDEDSWSALKPFLIYLNLITDDDFINIFPDLHVIRKLQQI